MVVCQEEIRHERSGRFFFRPVTFLRPQKATRGDPEGATACFYARSVEANATDASNQRQEPETRRRQRQPSQARFAGLPIARRRKVDGPSRNTAHQVKASQSKTKQRDRLRLIDASGCLRLEQQPCHPISFDAQTQRQFGMTEQPRWFISYAVPAGQASLSRLPSSYAIFA